MSSPAWASALRLIVTLGVLLLGTYGFHVAYAETGATGLRPLLGQLVKGLKLVAGQFPSDLAGRPLPWTLDVARVALPLLAFWTTASVVWDQVRNPIRASLLRARGGQLIAAGDEEIAGAVALSARKARRPVAVWTADPHQRWVQAAAGKGAAFIKAQGPDRGIAKLGLDKAACLMVAGPDDAENVDLAGAALEEAVRARPAGPPLTIIARVDDPDLGAPLERRFDRGADRRSARLRFASTPDISARRLFIRHPLDRFQWGDDTAKRIYLIGFAPVAERYVLRLLAGAHFSDGRRPVIVVLAPDAEHEREVFFARRPGAAKLAPVVFERASIEPPLVSASLEQAIAAHGPPTAVVVAPADGERNLAIALAVEDGFERAGRIAPPIYVHCDVRLDHKALSEGLVPFGGPSELADPELLLQDKLDGLARAIHQFYFEGRLAEGDQIGSRASMQPWDLLHEAVRDDNRLLADCYGLKLRDIGARIIEEPGQTALAFEPDELDALAKAEHDRWMSAKELDGWVYGEKRDDARKLHTDIVPYEALSEPKKDLDREQIRGITRLLGVSGRRAARDLVLLVDSGGVEAGPLAAGVKAALAGFADRYPERAVCLLAAFEDEPARAALAAGQEAGAVVQLTLSRNAAETLRELGREARSEAARLLRRADRIYALPEADWPPERRGDLLRGHVHGLITGSRPPQSSRLPAVQVGADGRLVSAPWPV